MLFTDNFNLLELLDLSLRSPEVGSVNFTILHTVLSHLITHLEIAEHKPSCFIEDTVAARTALIKSRMQDPIIKRRDAQRVKPTKDKKDIRKMIQKMEQKADEAEEKESTSAEDLTKTGIEEIITPVVEDIAERVMEKRISWLAEDIAQETKDEAQGGTSDQKPAEKKAGEVPEIWRSININRRMIGVEYNLAEMNKSLDLICDRLDELERVSNENQSKFDQLESYFERIRILESRYEDLQRGINEANELTQSEVERLEGKIKDLERELEFNQEALKELEKSHLALCETAATKEELGDLKNYFGEEMDALENKLKNKIKKLKDETVRKEDFAELVQRVDSLEADKVNRDELGRLLEPGFIDNFIDEQIKLRNELEELKITVSNIEIKLDELIKRIDYKILPDIQKTFEEIRAAIAEMKEKLDTIDVDDINDSFARLEEQADMIIKEMEALRLALERFEKEARANFKKLSDFSKLIERLEKTKADKTQVQNWLELKADIDMVKSKLDRSEFVSVIEDLQDTLHRLTITVKINKEDMDRDFKALRTDLSFKMYTQDFIVGTEPIRNRIKAMVYEQQKVKEIALQKLFPGAPGVTKCFSCKRPATMASLHNPVVSEGDQTGDANRNADIPKLPPINVHEEKGVPPKKPEKEKFPHIDLSDMEGVPIPPPDYPRSRNIHEVDILMASATPQVGLAHEKRKKVIDKEVEEYFYGSHPRAIGGDYTKTLPQQRGVTFASKEITPAKMREILLQGLDKRYLKGFQSQLPKYPKRRPTMHIAKQPSWNPSTSTVPKPMPKQDVQKH